MAMPQPDFMLGTTRSMVSMSQFNEQKQDYEKSLEGLSPGSEEFQAAISACHSRGAERCAKVAAMHRGLYVKAAQFIASIRGGTGDKGIPAAYIDALSVFTDRAPHKSIGEVAPVLKEAMKLGNWPAGPLDETCALRSIEETPIASASLAQATAQRAAPAALLGEAAGRASEDEARCRVPAAVLVVPCSIAREFATTHFGAATGTHVACIVDVDAGVPAPRPASDWERALPGPPSELSGMPVASLPRDVGSIRAGARVVGSSGYRAGADVQRGSPVQHYAELTDTVLDACDCVYVGTSAAAAAAVGTESFEGTTPSSHAALALRALRAGKHLLLEKPL
ncbi:unnamed protein product [Prorocentrum cordatum]|uniref:Gfo/Idh/MocA-like oxidoreductase N-terminal domain-containing protein n=1 Tax=Prorocentrum cordatum TaxID=2364126 RepID=A0ABN9WPI8_9DINO|nr:unnamed protein product [Polarella glacialis]